MRNLKKQECEIAQDAILIEAPNRIQKILYSDIVWFKTIGGYTSLKLCTSDELFTSDTLASFEKRLSSSFFRISRNIIINMTYVDLIQKKDTKHIVKLNMGEKLPVSRRRVKDLLDCFKLFWYKNKDVL